MIEKQPVAEVESKLVEVLALIAKHYQAIEAMRKRYSELEINGIMRRDGIEYIGDGATWESGRADRVQDYENIRQIIEAGGVYFHSHPEKEPALYYARPSTPDIRCAIVQGAEVIFHKLGITIVINLDYKDPGTTAQELELLWDRVQTGHEFAMEREYDDPPWIMHGEMMRKYRVIIKNLQPNKSTGKLEEVDDFLQNDMRERATPILPRIMAKVANAWLAMDHRGIHHTEEPQGK